MLILVLLSLKSCDLFVVCLSVMCMVLLDIIFNGNICVLWLFWSLGFCCLAIWNLMAFFNYTNCYRVSMLMTWLLYRAFLLECIIFGGRNQFIFLTCYLKSLKSGASCYLCRWTIILLSLLLHLNSCSLCLCNAINFLGLLATSS